MNHEIGPWSCGDHEPCCDEVRERVYFFIDHELDDASCEQIQHHLDACVGCVDEVVVERLVKTMLARSCSERAPVELRQRVRFSISQVQIEYDTDL